MLQEILTRNLKAARMRAGLSQMALAAKMGVSVSYIGMLERGVRCPPLSTLERLGSALSVDPADLLRRTAA